MGNVLKDLSCEEKVGSPNLAAQRILIVPSADLMLVGCLSSLLSQEEISL